MPYYYHSYTQIASRPIGPYNELALNTPWFIRGNWVIQIHYFTYLFTYSLLIKFKRSIFGANLPIILLWRR